MRKIAMHFLWYSKGRRVDKIEKQLRSFEIGEYLFTEIHVAISLCLSVNLYPSLSYTHIHTHISYSAVLLPDTAQYTI